jgi:hypothetical protein
MSIINLHQKQTCELLTGNRMTQNSCNETSIGGRKLRAGETV